jgi:hypothetical protein
MQVLQFVKVDSWWVRSEKEISKTWLSAQSVFWPI